MAINGTNRILYIKWEGVFLPVGSLQSDSFSEVSEMLDTTTIDNQGWTTSVPTNQSYNVSFSGIVINTNYIKGDFSKLSFDRLKILKRTRTLIEWKTADNNNVFIESGKAYITSLSDSAEIDNFITFNCELEGYGIPISTTEAEYLLQDGNDNNIQDGLENNITIT